MTVWAFLFGAGTLVAGIATIVCVFLALAKFWLVRTYPGKAWSDLGYTERDSIYMSMLATVFGLAAFIIGSMFVAEWLYV